MVGRVTTVRRTGRFRPEHAPVGGNQHGVDLVTRAVAREAVEGTDHAGIRVQHPVTVAEGDVGRRRDQRAQRRVALAGIEVAGDDDRIGEYGASRDAA
jgi:hypothetical protein